MRVKTLTVDQRSLVTPSLRSKAAETLDDIALLQHHCGGDSSFDETCSGTRGKSATKDLPHL